jgi:hypothetical protein
MPKFRWIGKLLAHGLLAASTLVTGSCKSKTSGPERQISLNIPPIMLSTKTDSITIGGPRMSTNDKRLVKQIHLMATLTNNTPGLIKYYSETCGWTMLFTTNSHSFFVDQNPCFQNWWFVDSIYPYRTKSYRLTLTTDPGNKENNVKLGFNFIRDIDVPNEQDVIDSIENRRHLVWSNPITLQLK